MIVNKSKTEVSQFCKAKNVITIESVSIDGGKNSVKGFKAKLEQVITIHTLELYLVWHDRQ